MISSRQEALSILGLGLSAKESDIKSAFKSLVKIYHPDAGPMANVDKYNLIVEAYEFLSTPIEGRLVGTQARKSSYTYKQPASAKDYDKFNKKMKKQKEERKKAFEEYTKEYSKQLEKQEEEYQNAMKAIDAILAARALETMIWANGIEKDNKK